MNKEKLLEFLNQQQQNSIKDYQYFDNNLKIKKGDMLNLCTNIIINLWKVELLLMCQIFQ